MDEPAIKAKDLDRSVSIFIHCPSIPDNSPPIYKSARIIRSREEWAKKTKLWTDPFDYVVQVHGSFRSLALQNELT
jgi:hypothetical protein